MGNAFISSANSAAIWSTENSRWILSLGPHTALIVRDDPQTFAEGRNLWLPLSGNAAQTAHEDQGIASRDVFIIDLPSGTAALGMYNVLASVTLSARVSRDSMLTHYSRGSLRTKQLASRVHGDDSRARANTWQ
jgi:hypothetical protein